LKIERGRKRGKTYVNVTNVSVLALPLLLLKSLRGCDTYSCSKKKHTNFTRKRKVLPELDSTGAVLGLNDPTDIAPADEVLKGISTSFLAPLPPVE